MATKGSAWTELAAEPWLMPAPIVIHPSSENCMRIHVRLEQGRNHVSFQIDVLPPAEPLGSVRLNLG